MASSSNIPRPTIKRLSLYLRSLESHQPAGTATVSSRQLGQSVGITDVQVRKDLGNIGQLGQPGIGYQVEALRGELRRVLKTDREWNAVVVGVGNIGSAILHYPHFGSKGFRIVAALDASPDRIGQRIAALRVQPMADLPAIVAEHDVRIGILAVPAEAAQSVAAEMTAAGIQGILNFAPIRIDVGNDAEVASVDLSRSLEQLAYQVGIGD
ncbi:MAG: redox-sensing transcriptional repressor Rex [Phycisphaerales bacterium]|nr:redox-sensing transcriptional repressor Rex [Phycisphaerales bacterium]